MQWISLRNSKCPHGFTLVEIQMVMVVSAIVLSLAAPSFMNIIANNRVASAANDLVVVLNLGKSEAVKSGKTAVLCKSNDGNTCDGNTEWKNGWILFLDEDGDNTLNDNERIIRAQGESNDGLDLKFRPLNADSIGFKPNGQINKSGRFCFRNAHNEANSRAVIIYRTGRIRTEARDSTNNDCDEA